MRKRTEGQSMVEMALLLPVFMLIIFGIIDLSYYVFGYSTMYQAARNGAEKAADIPPYANKLNDPTDICVANIRSETQRIAVRFPDLTTDPSNSITIRYPTGVTRGLGQPIEVSIVYYLKPLTPLWRFVTFGASGTMRIQTTARRSIEALGDNPTALNLVACQP